MALSACTSKEYIEVVASDAQANEAPAASAPSKLCFTEARLDQQITLLSHQHGVSITALGDIGEERVSIVVDETELETIIDKIAKSKGWTWIRFDDGSYGIASEEWYRANIHHPNSGVTKVFRPEHVRASELEAAIRNMLSPIGRMTFDDRTNKILIVERPDRIAAIERFIREVDQPRDRAQGPATP